MRSMRIATIFLSLICALIAASVASCESATYACYCDPQILECSSCYCKATYQPCQNVIDCAVNCPLPDS